MAKNEKKQGTKGLFKKLGGQKETAPVEEAKPTETPADDDMLATLANINVDEISKEELEELFARYLGPEGVSALDADGLGDDFEAATVEAPAIPETDVKKNIGEAEEYINSITENAEKTNLPTAEELAGEVTGGFALEIQNTEQLAAFEPDTSEEPTDPSLHETRVMDARKTTEQPIPEMPTDTAMMKAFGLDPKTGEMRVSGEVFEDIRMQDETEMPATEELGAITNGKDSDWDTLPTKDEKHAGFEYTDPSQNKDIFATFKAKYNFAKIRMTLAAALVVLLGLLENLPGVAEFFGSNQVLVAIDWVLTLAAAALVFDRMVAAVKSLGKFEFDCDSITLFSFIFSFVATAVSLFATPTYEDVYLFNFPFAICVFLSAMNLFIMLRQDVYSFKIISSSETKKILARTSSTYEDVPEKASFAEYLGTNENVCTIKKTDFISNFFAHRNEKSTSKFLLKIFVPECAVFAILFFVVSCFLMDNSVAASLETAYAAFMMSVPFTAFITYSYPIYLASRRAYSYHSAILGDKTHENYEKTGVIAFRDEDAFPANRTKVKSLKLYGERKIESVMYYASSVYAKLGGPLATVFKQATLNSEISSDIELREIAPDGVSAMVDGKNIVIGRPAYMDAQCFETMFDEGDEEYEGKTNRRILYLACDQIIIAKFYVQYTTTSDFLYMANRLTNSGVSISIRTADPGIDSGVLYSNKMNPEELPVKVVGAVLPDEKCADVSARTGGIVSIGTAKEITKTFLVCDKIENVKKTNFVLKTVASILGVAVMCLVLFTGHASELRSIFPAIYQVFWLIPIYVISKIYI